MGIDDLDVQIRRHHHDGGGSYQLLVDGVDSGELDYRDADGRRLMVHTGVRPRLEGLGLGGRLAHQAVVDARAEGLEIVPRCSFVARYLADHPDLLAAGGGGADDATGGAGAATRHPGAMEIEIRHDPAGADGQYTLIVDGKEAGELTYRDIDGRRAFTHTGVRDEYEGHGLAGQLARRVLDDARAEGLKIVPLCPYVRGYLERHPEDQDLVDEELWARYRR